MLFKDFFSEDNAEDNATELQCLISLDNDGDLSDYERTRGEAIQKSLLEQDEDKVEMAHGGMANGKKHMYAAGGSVMDSLTPGQKKMVMAMAKDNRKS